MSTDQPDTSARGLQLLMEIAELIAAELGSSGISTDTSRKVGLHVAEQVRHTYGGENLYFPKGAIIELKKQYWQIWDEFNGHNHLLLAKKYNLSVRRIEQIIASCRAEHDRKQQIPLFD